MRLFNCRIIGLLMVLEIARQQAVSMDRPGAGAAYSTAWILVLGWALCGGKR